MITGPLAVRCPCDPTINWVGGRALGRVLVSGLLGHGRALIACPKAKWFSSVPLPRAQPVKLQVSSFLSGHICEQPFSLSASPLWSTATYSNSPPLFISLTLKQHQTLTTLCFPQSRLAAPGDGSRIISCCSKKSKNEIALCAQCQCVCLLLSTRCDVPNNVTLRLFLFLRACICQTQHQTPLSPIPVCTTMCKYLETKHSLLSVLQ